MSRERVFGLCNILARRGRRSRSSSCTVVNLSGRRPPVEATPLCSSLCSNSCPNSNLRHFGKSPRQLVPRDLYFCSSSERCFEQKNAFLFELLLHIMDFSPYLKNPGVEFLDRDEKCELMFSATELLVGIIVL